MFDFAMSLDHQIAGQTLEAYEKVLPSIFETKQEAKENTKVKRSKAIYRYAIKDLSLFVNNILKENPFCNLFQNMNDSLKLRNRCS
jgi:hypothetical protein